VCRLVRAFVVWSGDLEERKFRHQQREQTIQVEAVCFISSDALHFTRPMYLAFPCLTQSGDSVRIRPLVLLRIYRPQVGRHFPQSAAVIDLPRLWRLRFTPNRPTIKSGTPHCLGRGASEVTFHSGNPHERIHTASTSTSVYTTLRSGRLWRTAGINPFSAFIIAYLFSAISRSWRVARSTRRFYDGERIGS